MLLSVCLVSYNTAELTVTAVKSVISDLKQSELLAKAAEIIVVDNNSADDSVKQLTSIKTTSTIPLQILISKTNRGFAGANNYAVKHTTGEHILLLNSDTFVQSGTLTSLVTTMMETPEESTATLSSRQSKLDHLGILAATLLNPDGSVQPQGGSLPNLFSLITHLWFLDDLPVIGRLLPSTQHTGWRTPKLTTDQLIKTGWVAGTAMLIKREVIKEVGLLDEHIFMYGEDVEYCLRATHHHWDVAIHPQAYVTHLKSASSTKLNAIIGEMNGYLYIWAKHKPAWESIFARAIITSGIWLRMIIFGTIGQTDRRKIYQEALAQIK